ncbi:ferrochelatase [Plesiomonas shigelloides]|jgi:ferrochelatase|uniref:Ferrochelatase n=1 Tax=Plesiomonas shigelloides 302-73 TaxID=1315976 RepID=R8AP45_PLESH|nr:ferrochelatase [Plesiomonas shigelloides]EON88098.1 ferrochelatase [Plesiomonas shigelloides 302-73]
MSEKQHGILLVNLGTPDAPTPAAVRRYLSEFLHDHRVVDMSRWLWCPLLHGIILPLRSPRVARLYQSVWTDDGSPLLAFSRRQQAALTQLLAEREMACPVELGMTYGQPSIAQALDVLQAQGVTHLTVLPLFPQYSSSTTAAVWDGLSKALRTRRNLPAIRFIRDYHDNPHYIAALAEKLRRSLPAQDSGDWPDKLLFSFHGLPQRYVDEGDEYARQCEVTAQAVADELGLTPEQWQLSYQSRFGREEWLKPYTDQTLTAWPAQGVRKIAVVCPGFAADCLETLEEIAEQNQHTFLQAGGEQFTYVAALNDDRAHIELMYHLVQNEM